MRLRLFRGRVSRRSGSHRRAGRPDTSPSGLAGTQQRQPVQADRTAGWLPPGRLPRADAGTVARRAGGTAAPGVTSAVARAAIRAAPGAPASAVPGGARSVAADARAGTGTPWYAGLRAAPGLRNCGCLEEVLVREWPAGTDPGPAVVTAISRLADLPLLVKQKLVAGLNAIHVGPGGVPDLDDMGALRGVPLPSGQATWDACAGAYGSRKIVIGSRPSPTPDVTCHEVGHALDELDGQHGQWQSDCAAFQALYLRCLPHLASEFHRNGGSLGRREFFADAFAAIASGQRPALVAMLSGDTRTALDVMLHFNVRYGI